jgi:hypothetical protein
LREGEGENSRPFSFLKGHAVATKKKIPLIEHDKPRLRPADLALMIEEALRNDTGQEVVIEAYQLTFQGGITFTWSKKNES